MKKYLSTLAVVGTFLGLSVWCVWANLSGNEDQKALFSDSYWILPLICGVIGLTTAKRWGGIKSVFGKAVVFLSIGLLAQVFGQVVYSYYAHVQHVDAPYPSIGDIGFFGAVIAYIIGAHYLSKTVGARLSTAKLGAKVIALVIPAALLVGSYYLFLNGYEYDASNKVTTFLDFGYPLGQAIYVALAFLAYFLSRNLLGGIMRSRVLLVLAALVVQYFADFIFLFRFSRDQYSPGEITDFVYLLAYLVMGLALIGLIRAYEGLLDSAKRKTLESANV